MKHGLISAVVLGWMSLASASSPASAAGARGPSGASVQALDERVIAHMQFHGYVAEPGVSPAVYRFVHKNHLNLSIRQRKDGFLVGSWYRATSYLLAHRGDCLTVLNDINEQTLALRAYMDQAGDVALEAYFPGDYQQANFNEFLDTLSADEALLFGEPIQSRMQRCVQ